MKHLKNNLEKVTFKDLFILFWAFICFKVKEQAIFDIDNIAIYFANDYLGIYYNEKRVEFSFAFNNPELKSVEDANITQTIFLILNYYYLDIFRSENF